MIPCKGGVLVAFSSAGGNRHHIWFNPNGEALGGGELRYDGSSPVTAMTVFDKRLFLLEKRVPPGKAAAVDGMIDLF
jgi:hypothetical protein